MTATPTPATAPKLAIELVPRSAWCSNMRAFLRPGKWQCLTKIALETAGHRCEACGSRGRPVGKNRATVATKFRLETHETWDFNTDTRVQKLIRNRALCPDCHESIHLGLADIRGRGEGARKHMALVNNWTPDQVAQHEAAAWRLWHERNQIEAWIIDINVVQSIDVVSYEAAMSFLRELPRRAVIELESRSTAGSAAQQS